MITTPTERMKAFGAMLGKERTAAARTTRPTSLSASPPRGAAVAAGVAELEALGKTTSEESLRADHQGREQRDVEDGLCPGGPHRDLQQALAQAEDQGRDRGPRYAAEPADHDDRHERADPVPVQRGVDRRVERQGGAADRCRRQAQPEPVSGDPL